MSDAAAKDVGSIVERLLAGWPVYGVVLVFLAGYSELYIEKKISDGIKAETGQTFTVTELSKDVALNTDAVNDLALDVSELTTTSRELNADVKETLRILASQ
jgi:hypothetical protein